MNLAVAHRTRRHNFYLLLLLFFFTACNKDTDDRQGEKINLWLLSQNVSTIGGRGKVLRYVDSLYRIQKYKSAYLQTGRKMAYANRYFRDNNFSEATRYIDSAIVTVNKQNLSDATWVEYYCSSYLLKGQILFAEGEYDKAIDNYFKAKLLADKTDNHCRINDAIDNFIGLVLYRQKKYDAARSYFKLALTLQQSCEVDKYKYKAFGEQELLDNIALSFSKEDKKDSALVYYHRALRLTQTDTGRFNKNPVINRAMRETSKGIIMGNIAQLLVAENKLDSAEILFKKNIEINGKTFKSEAKDAQLSQLYLADVYRRKRAYPKMKQALAELRKSLDTLPDINAELGWRKLTTDYDAETYLPPGGLKGYRRYESLKDSLAKSEQASQLDINQALDVKGQQLRLSLLQKDNELKQVYLVITVALSVIALAIGGLVYYYYRRGKKNIQTLTLLNREIGEQKDKLEFARAELEKSDAAKERILKVVAHDLRNPISGIATLTNSIINDGLSEEDEKLNLDIIEKASANSLTLINELMEHDFSRGHIKLNKTREDIDATIKQCVGLMQLIADKKHQKIHLSGLPKALEITIDKEKIGRMINNLLSNAIKYSQDGKLIAVEIEQNDNTVLIAVKDNGIGIPEGMHDEVFNALSILRRKGTAGEKSFGFGLSICRQIAEAHGGKIWVQTQPGGGAAFYVELPLV